METNESICKLKVVGTEDHAVLGQISGLRVDCDKMVVDNYIIDSAEATHRPLVLPFNSVIAVGDAFVTVPGRKDFLRPGTEEEEKAVDGYDLVGAQVYSRTGNSLGKVTGYEFDTVFGTVEGITLDDGSHYAAAAFLFFSPEFVFVDDGSRDAASLRGAEKERRVDEVEKQAYSGYGTENAPRPVESSSLSDEERELVGVLLDSELTEDVVSEDGAFRCTKGTKITQEVVARAREHDALLALAMSVE